MRQLIETYRLNKRPMTSSGFTLLEMLVVLVILGLTTSVLSQGLATTWQNFERLGAKQLSLSSAELPRQWFRDSVKHALLYHPFEPIVRGGPVSFRVVSAAVPNDPENIPTSMEWVIKEGGGIWSLGFFTDGTDIRVIKTSMKPLKFQYLTQEVWQTYFSPKESRLPTAVRIIDGFDTWALAVPGRPEKADVPRELALFGEYDF